MTLDDFTRRWLICQQLSSYNATRINRLRGTGGRFNMIYTCTSVEIVTSDA